MDMNVTGSKGYNQFDKTTLQGLSGVPEGNKGSQSVPQNKIDKIDIFKPNTSSEINSKKPEENPALNGLNGEDKSKKGLDISA